MRSTLPATTTQFRKVVQRSPGTAKGPSVPSGSARASSLHSRIRHAPWSRPIRSVRFAIEGKVVRAMQSVAPRITSSTTGVPEPWAARA